MSSVFWCYNALHVQLKTTGTCGTDLPPPLFLTFCLQIFTEWSLHELVLYIMKLETLSPGILFLTLHSNFKSWHFIIQSIYFNIVFWCYNALHVQLKTTGTCGTDLPPPLFLTFCLQIYFQYIFFISLLFHLNCC
jgi:hypothetical protein